MLVKCLICLKSISKADYKMHMETHSMKKVCEVCSEEFQDNLSYEKHRILVKDLGEFWCQCGKVKLTFSSILRL